MKPREGLNSVRGRKKKGGTSHEGRRRMRGYRKLTGLRIQPIFRVSEDVMSETKRNDKGSAVGKIGQGPFSRGSHAMGS